METRKKSTFEVWQKWAKVLAAQLHRVLAVYEEHKELASAKNLRDLVQRLELFVDPLAHAPELAKRGYAVSGHLSQLQVLSLHELYKLFQESLNAMPRHSEDMQRLLKSPATGSCNGRIASDIFKGSHRSENEGLGRGIPEANGGLPWQLERLIDAADFGGDAYFNEGLGRSESDEDGTQSGAAGDGSPHAERHAIAQPRKKITATGVQ